MSFTEKGVVDMIGLGSIFSIHYIEKTITEIGEIWTSESKMQENAKAPAVCFQDALLLCAAGPAVRQLCMALLKLLKCHEVDPVWSGLSSDLRKVGSANMLSSCL